MKGYITNNIEYIFEVEAAEIPYVGDGVTGIAIQPECLDAFKEANPSYADLMFGYNFQTITAQPKPFAGHTDDDLTPPEPPVETYSLTVAGAQCGEVSTDNLTTSVHYEPASTNQVAENNTIRSTANENSTFDITSVEEKRKLVATFNIEALTPSLDGTYVEFTMPNFDSTIIIDEYIVSGPTLTIDGEDAPGFRPSIKDENDNRVRDGDSVAEGTTITISIKSAQLDNFTFDQSNPDSKEVIYVYLDNVGLSKDADAETITFTMPGTNAELLMTVSPLT